MTTVRLTKQQILEAIEKEPITTLVTGHWFNVTEAAEVNGKPPNVSNPNCEVCAVGAVLRNALDQEQSGGVIIDVAIKNTGRVATPTYDEDDNLDEDAVILQARSRLPYPMSALSIVFEGLAEIYDWNMRRAKTKTVEFVRDFFPETVDIDIMDAKPGPGIEVVV